MPNRFEKIPPRRFAMPPLTLAIQPDHLRLADGRIESFSDRWMAMAAQQGLGVREVDVRRADIVEQLRGCDALLWRHLHLPRDRQIAQRLLPVIENYLKLVVFPDQATCWHYDDKIAQSYLFDAVDIPTPRTWVYWTWDRAEAFCREAPYPLVMKLACGAGSQNVCLVHTARQALRRIDELFRQGTTGFTRPRLATRMRRTFRGLGRRVLLRKAPVKLENRHQGYVYFQEFLPDNAFDTRITIIGQRAFGFRRFNRPNDFRASGSGRLDYTPAGVDPAFVQLAARVARRLNMQSCAIDGLYRDGQAVVSEISYTFDSLAVYRCPGHWRLNPKGEPIDPVWQQGETWPQDAQLADLIDRLYARKQAVS